MPEAQSWISESGRHIRRVLTLGCVLPLLLVAGCASPPKPSAVPDVPPRSLTDYVIGPGDTLDIFVWRNPEISKTVPVRPDGKITTPLVEDMPAVGKTPSELARDIEAVLSTYVRNPDVTVTVTNFVGTFKRQIRVIGQAVEPKALPYRENITLLDVMIEVGGLTEFAAGNRAKVVRSYEGKEQEIRVRLKDLIQKGDTSENIRMFPGDVLIIPETRI
jgi:polysaccharide export outer membrane protein